MQIRLRDTGAVISDYEFRAMYPDTSFPAQLTPEILNDFGADPVLNAPQPEHGEFQIVVQEGATQDEAGEWIQNWVIKPMFVEYTDPDGVVHTVAEQEAAYVEQQNQQKRQLMIVSPLQAKVELLERALLDEVEAVIAASGDPVVQLAWNSATQFARLSPLVLVIAEELEWDDAYLDNLFVEAAQRTF